MFIEVSARERADEARRESEEKYRFLVENQTDLVVKVDTQNRFLFASPSYCRTFGKTEQELLGNTFIPVVHADDREATLLAMRALERPPHTCSARRHPRAPLPTTSDPGCAARASAALRVI
jgi:PAS domain S-box-containing protein